MDLKRVSLFLTSIHLFIFFCSDMLHSISPQTHLDQRKKITIALSLAELPEGLTDGELRRDSFDIDEEFTEEKNWKRKVIFIGLIISISLDVFLGVSLLVMTLFHLNLHFIVEYTILSIDAITLIADLLLFLYYLVQLMQEKYSKATTEKKKKHYRLMFTIVFLSLFLTTPAIITPIFLNLSLSITIPMIAIGILSFFIYIIISLKQFIYKKFKSVLQNKEHLSRKTLITSLLKPIVTFLLILTFCCIIPIFSHLTHTFKFAWLLISFTVILLAIPLLMENSLRTSIEEELFNEGMNNYLEKNSSKNLLGEKNRLVTFQKDLQRLELILSTKKERSPFYQNVVQQWKNFEEQFGDLMAKNKEKFLIELSDSDSMHSFFKSIVDDKEKRKTLKKAIKLLKKDLKNNPQNKEIQFITMQRYIALSEILSPSFFMRQFKKKDALTRHYRVLLYSS